MSIYQSYCYTNLNNINGNRSKYFEQSKVEL